ncbi:HAD hydrolase-like protein, partial [Herbaspirillum frisingense]
MPLRPPRAILFDLDGTLADTAPDLAAAANFLRQERGLDDAPYEQLRPVASAGARGLIGAALGIHPEHDEYEALRVRFLDRYEANMSQHSRLFDGIPELLAQLESRQIAWGIVTNKAARFTDVLAPQIGLGHAACIVSGDTT